MRKKKIICSLLSLCVLFAALFSASAFAAQPDGPRPVTLSLFSNQTPESYLPGLYMDNVFYVSLDDLCKLTGGQVKLETTEQAVITLSGGIREFDIDVGSGNMADVLYSDPYNVTMPSLLYDERVYVSALHFLRYIGATVQLRADGAAQLMVVKRYDIFDALADYVASDQGNFFWWDEVDCGDESLEKKLTNAGVIALIDRDSNIFRMAFDAKGIMQEALEDALLSIVKNEGQAYFADNSMESELIDGFGDLIGMESDWFDLIRDAYTDGSDALGDQISDLASNAAAAASFAGSVVSAFESLRQFDNMSSAQRDLLAKTILRYPEDSKTLCDGWDVVYDAAQTVDAKIQSEYGAQYEAALEIAESTAYDFLSGAAGGNPVSIAWSGVNILTKAIPFTGEMIERKVQLYNGYNCSMIQLIANEMLVEAYSDWYYNNGLYTAPADQVGKLDSVRHLLILQLKSTLTTRECLIGSGFLEAGYAAEMSEKNRATARLLNRAENCKITGVNLFAAEYEDDLSWMEELPAIDYSSLVTDAYGTESSYVTNLYDPQTGKGEDTQLTVSFRIPQINLPGDDIEEMNGEIYDALYPIIQDSVSEITEYGYPYTSAGVSYGWAVNGDVLSLVTRNDSHPEASGGREFMVYNVSLSAGAALSDETVVEEAGFSMEEYRKLAEQALGARFWEGWDRSNTLFQDRRFAEQFNESLGNTISRDNVGECFPYLNDAGHLCIAAKIYSLAGADFYWNELDLNDFTPVPDYADGVEIKTGEINISEDEAQQIAYAYWDYTPGDSSPETGFEFFVSSDGTRDDPNTGKTYYCFLLRWLVDADTDTAHMSTCDWVYIDAETGECSSEMP